jgi:hypothetical protein
MRRSTVFPTARAQASDDPAIGQRADLGSRARDTHGKDLADRSGRSVGHQGRPLARDGGESRRAVHSSTTVGRISATVAFSVCVQQRRAALLMMSSTACSSRGICGRAPVDDRETRGGSHLDGNAAVVSRRSQCETFRRNPDVFDVTAASCPPVGRSEELINH